MLDALGPPRFVTSVWAPTNPMRFSLPISPKYDSPIFEAVVIQIIVGLCGLLAIDPVGIAQVFGIVLLAFWGGVAVLIFRHPQTPTKTDLLFISFGYLPIIVLAFFMSVGVWKLRGF